jgi:iron-sulfur cluster repair protein YtfE (RIC family)
VSRISNLLTNITKDRHSNGKKTENACITFVVVYLMLMEFQTEMFHRVYLLANFDSC